MYRKAHGDSRASKLFSRTSVQKRVCLSNLRAWIQGKPDLQDIADMFGPEVENNRSAAPKEGLVYLIKSGAHYKIGRSDELERRVKQIRVSLPEARTYCTRFEQMIRRVSKRIGIVVSQTVGPRRMFKLGAADVAAFKRRKYHNASSRSNLPSSIGLAFPPIA